MASTLHAVEREGLLPMASPGTPNAKVAGTAVMSWDFFWFCFVPLLIVIFGCSIAFFPPVAIGMVALAVIYVTLLLIIFFFFRQGFQLWALQRPNNLFARLLMPCIENVDSWKIGVAETTIYTQLKAGGGNFCGAGMVWLTSFQEVSAALTSPQGRTEQLGEHPMIPKHVHDSKSGRCVFLLALSDKLAGGNGDHEGFRQAILDYFFNDEARARETDAVAQQLYDNLKKDFKEGDFFTSTTRGNQVFWMKYLHHVLMGMDVNDGAVHDALAAVHIGQAPMGYYMNTSGHLLFYLKSKLEKVCELYVGSPALRNFKDHDPKYNGLTKHELSYLMVEIIRLAGVQGSQFYTSLLTSGKPGTESSGLLPVDVRDYWDSLDLSNEQEIRRYILEVGRLSPPVTVSHRVSTEPFTTEIKGKKYTFPAGVKVAIPIVTANVDKSHWGGNAYSFDHRRPKLEESYMNFNSVGGKHAGRECPAKDLVLRSQTRLLQVLGADRARKPYPGPSPPVASLPAKPAWGCF